MEILFPPPLQVKKLQVRFDSGTRDLDPSYFSLADPDLELGRYFVESKFFLQFNGSESLDFLDMKTTFFVHQKS